MKLKRLTSRPIPYLWLSLYYTKLKWCLAFISFLLSAIMNRPNSALHVTGLWLPGPGKIYTCMTWKGNEFMVHIYGSLEYHKLLTINVSFTVEFIEVGKKEPALDALYDVIKSKKHRTWQNKIHEPILFKYLELCVDLRRSHIAKEGLYQYKLICQQVNIVSLEDVIRYFLKLAEDRAETARKESRDQVPIVEDLDQIQTPERYSLVCNVWHELDQDWSIDCKI